MASNPHVVLLPFPAQGHINPMMLFARKLASHGLTITFVNTQHTQELMTQSHQQTPSSPDYSDRHQDIRVIAIPDGLPPDHGRTTNVLEWLMALESHMKEEFETLLKRLVQQDPPVTFVVSDVLMSWTWEVSKKLGLGQVFFWTARTAMFMLYYHTPFTEAQGYFRVRDHEEDELITCIPGLPPMLLSDLQSFLIQKHSLGQIVRGYFLRRVEALQTEKSKVFFNSFYELEKDAFDAMRTTNTVLYPVGPLHWDSGTGDARHKGPSTSMFKEDESCLEWLDQQPNSSVLYVSFGSLAMLSHEQVVELALGLEASQHRFLWVLRANLAGGRAAQLPQGFSARTRDRGKVVAWAPQVRVLAHGAVGGFLTHGGWNSTLETMTMGVPTLCWPYWSEQGLNCVWMVENLKVGIHIRKVEEDVWVGREVLEEKLRALMGEEGEELRRRAKELREAAMASWGEGGSSQANLDALVVEILLNTTPP